MSNGLIKIDGNIPVEYIPAKVNFEGYEGFKTRVVQLHDKYINYTVTPENLKEAKAELKKLKSFHARVNKRRITITNDIQQPAKDFKAKVDELLDIADEAKTNIEEQINVFEQKEVAERKRKKIKKIEELCELAGVDADKILWQKNWDNKTITNKLFEKEVNDQIALLKQEQIRITENTQVVANKADELGLPADHWINLLKNTPLPDVLTQMADYKSDLTSIASEQRKTKKRELQDLKIVGDRYIDATTGEIKDKVITLRLELQGTKWQISQLKNFLKLNAIKYRGLRD